MNNESQILNVPIEDIIPNRFQPRLNFDEAGLKELAASIKEHGIIQPLVLRRLGDKYEIIAGERRYKASKLAGLTSVPAIISSLDDRKSAEVAIVENVQRRDLSSIEEAKSYKALLDKGYLTQEELAKKMGLSQSAISNKLRLLSLSDKVQEALMENKISERHARSLLQLENLEEQDEWLEKITTERLTVRELDKRIKEQKYGTKEDKIEDIPLVELTPNINNIKEKATDIIPEHQDIIDINPSPVVEEVKPIPNKFFNYLEDEQANMSIEEPIYKNDIEPPTNVEEEIELLDFTIPEATSVSEIQAPINEQIKEEPIVIKDMSVANNLTENLINELRNSNYNVKLEKNETNEEIKFIITIEK